MYFLCYPIGVYCVYLTQEARYDSYYYHIRISRFGEKQTFLQHILKEHKPTDKVLIIENDFGETSLDAANLAKTGATIREVTSGCICCSLQGNFQQALLDILQNYDVDIIYIEPSGVSKLSEIIHTCEDEDIAKSAYVHASVTTVDAMQAPMFIKTLVYSLKIKSQTVTLFS